MNTDTYAIVFGAGWLIISILCAPLLPGIVAAVRAHVLGESVPSVLATYRQMGAAFRRNPIYPDCATYISRITPAATVALFLSALCFLPVTSNLSALIFFPGDFILVIMLMATSRFLAVAAAMDSGQNIALKGVSRWLSLVTLTDPTLYLIIMTAIILTSAQTLSGIPMTFDKLDTYKIVPFILISLALFVVLLFENQFIPFEDMSNPHETNHVVKSALSVHSGYNQGFMTYAVSLKFWIYSWLFSIIAVPHGHNSIADFLLHLLIPFLLAAGIGVISALRPLTRPAHLPRFLYAALLMAMLSLIFAVVTVAPTGGGS